MADVKLDIVDRDTGEPWSIEFTATKVNSIDFGRELIEQRSLELAQQREAYSRKLLERRLPRRLHWTLDHPRALRVLLRFVPRWRPTMAFVPLGITATASAAVEASERWLREIDLRAPLDSETDGHVFTYTDASGLPAEVYRP